MVEPRTRRLPEAVRGFKSLGDMKITWGIGMPVTRKIVETLGTW